MVIILLIALIFMNRDFTDISAKKEQEEKDVRLNIALVNEDIGIHKEGADYNLGADYVKKIEKDTTYNWFTVSRGIGENGLKNGTYNLLVTIPSNFSSKLLDVDSVAPEKVQVNYKINANGNATLENESKSAGNKIVNGLNQQLVDMYVVSILSNLFTAQKNIEKVYNNQTNSVNNFQSILYQPTINFKEYLPSITSQSHSALQANDLLTTTLTEFLKNPDALISSQQEFSGLLDGLIKQRAEGKVSYEDFVAILMSMDQSVLSAETNKLYSNLDSLNQGLQQDFIASQDGSGQYIKQMDALNEQLVESQKKVEEQTTALTNIEDKYFDTYKEQFFKSLNVSTSIEQPKATFADVLKKMGYKTPDLNAISKFNQNYLEKMQKRLNSLPYKVDGDGNPLFDYAHPPYGDGQPLTDIKKQTEKALEKIETINETINLVNEKNQENPDIPQLNPLIWETDPAVVAESYYYRDLERAYSRLTDQRNNIFKQRKYFTIETTDLSGGTITFGEIPEGIRLFYGSDEEIYPGVPFTISGNYTNRKYIYYQFSDTYNEQSSNVPIVPITISLSARSVKTLGRAATPNVKVIAPTESSNTTGEENATPTEPAGEGDATAEPTQGEATQEAAPTQETIIPVTQTITPTPKATDPVDPTAPVDPAEIVEKNYTIAWQQTIDTSAFLSERYQTAKKDYAEEVGKIRELYKTVNDELQDYEKYPFEIFNNLLGMDLTTMFKAVLNETFNSGDYLKQKQQLTDLQKSATDIQRQSDTIKEKLSDIQANTASLNETVQEQLVKLDEWQKTSKEMTTAETKIAADNTSTDTEISAIDTMLDALKKQTELLKDTSDMNVKEAESVKSVFTSFDQEVARAQKNGEDLSSNADVIMEQLNKELANNNDFVSSFIKVLDNAHKDGVPNNTLLQFIANPVNGKSEATIKTTEINEPFTWILIMYTMSLFTAYLFATQPIVRKVKDRFKREELWFKDNIMETIFLTVVGFVLGLILGLLSIGELGIIKEAQIVWLMMIVLFMLIFTLLNHYLLKQFKVSGFAISLFLFISYIFVTNAIGVTKGNNPMVQLISFINPLSVGENNLSDILASQALNVTNIILYLLLLVGLFLFNLFIWNPRKRKGKGVTAK